MKEALEMKKEGNDHFRKQGIYNGWSENINKLQIK